MSCVQYTRVDKKLGKVWGERVVQPSRAGRLVKVKKWANVMMMMFSSPPPCFVKRSRPKLKQEVFTNERLFQPWPRYWLAIKLWNLSMYLLQVGSSCMQGWRVSMEVSPQPFLERCLKTALLVLPNTDKGRVQKNPEKVVWFKTRLFPDIF